MILPAIKRTAEFQHFFSFCLALRMAPIHGNTDESMIVKNPESCLDSPFKTTALVLLVLCNYERNENTTYEMLDFLKGPESVSGYEKQFIKERLAGKYYKPFSYFAGTSPKNGYIPTEPFTITVYENPYSFDNENWAIMWVKSSGADTERQVKLRRKPSTNQWFLNEILCLSDIRIPESEDPWA